MAPQRQEKLRRRPFFHIADRHEKLYGRSRLYTSAQGRHKTGGVLSLFSSLSFDISMKNSVQRWSSDFQGLIRVKIRKMALGRNDLSTLPLKSTFFQMVKPDSMVRDYAIYGGWARLSSRFSASCRDQSPEHCCKNRWANISSFGHGRCATTWIDGQTSLVLDTVSFGHGRCATTWIDRQTSLVLDTVDVQLHDFGWGWIRIISHSCQIRACFLNFPFPGLLYSRKFSSGI